MRTYARFAFHANWLVLYGHGHGFRGQIPFRDFWSWGQDTLNHVFRRGWWWNDDLQFYSISVFRSWRGPFRDLSVTWSLLHLRPFWWPSDGSPCFHLLSPFFSNRWKRIREKAGLVDFRQARLHKLKKFVRFVASDVNRFWSPLFFREERHCRLLAAVRSGRGPSRSDA